MKRMRTKKKLITLNMGVLIIASMLVYPIFALNAVEDSIEIEQKENELTESNVIEEPKEIITPINEEEKEVESNASIVTNVQPRATVGTQFTANIINNGVQNLPCNFEVLTLASEGAPGTVKVARSAIDKGTKGTIAFPDEVSDGMDTYIITTIGESAFQGCNEITSTGLANNTTITSVGENAYMGCDGFTSTGLEKNEKVTTLGRYVFEGCDGLMNTGLAENTTLTTLVNYAFASCKRLTSTGLENNTTITTLGSAAFRYCDNLASTGLERNTTITFVGDDAFYSCPNLDDIIFEITTLPTMGRTVFANCNVNIYYPSGTTNPEVLNNQGAVSTQVIVLNDIHVKVSPKVEYIEKQIFNPEGLVISGNFNYGDRDIAYNDSTKGNFGFDKKELALGDSSVTINYGGKTVTQNITVVKKVLTGIKVKTAPNKTNYIEEEMFDPTGLVLTTIYNDEIEETVVYNDSTKGNFSFDKTEVKLGDKSIEITYGGKSTTQVITVKEKSVIDIKVKVKPTKVKYIEREDFEADGLVLTVYYDNGKNEDVTYDDSTKDDVSFDITIVNYRDTEIVITYKGKTVSQAIEVEAKPIDNIVIKSKPTKIEYMKGEVLDPEGLVISVNYEDGDTAIIPYNEKTKVDFVFTVKKATRMLQRSNGVVLGLEDKEIVVAYRGIETNLVIQVNQKEVTEIKILTLPNKIEYLEGETFAPEGLVLEVSYNDGTSEEVKYEEKNKGNFTFDKRELGKEDKKIEITYLGKKVELAIKVEVPVDIVVPDKGTQEATEEKVVDTRDATNILLYLVLSAIASLGAIISIKQRKVNM